MHNLFCYCLIKNNVLSLVNRIILAPKYQLTKFLFFFLFIIFIGSKALFIFDHLFLFLLVENFCSLCADWSRDFISMFDEKKFSSFDPMLLLVLFFYKNEFCLFAVSKRQVSFGTIYAKRIVESAQSKVFYSRYNNYRSKFTCT